MRILVLEDDLSLGQSLQKWLAQKYDVTWARTIQEFHSNLRRDSIWNLFILDVNLPDGNGFELAQDIVGSKVPIMFLTAEGDAESRLRGYEAGAHEYIPKPFHLKELGMRIEHVLNSHPLEKRVIQLEGIEIDLQGLSVKRENGEIEYPPLSDMKILKALIDRSPEPVSRDELIDLTWGKESNPSHRSIDNSIVRIKKFLGPKAEELIRSVRGIGYQWTNKE